jgi:hypothetical protein
MTKSRLRILVATGCGLAILAPVLVEAVAQAGVPRSIASGEGRYYWRASSEIMNRDGQWLVEDLPSTVRKRVTEIEGLVARPTLRSAEECVRVRLIVEYPPTLTMRPASLDALVGNAEAVILGTVVDRSGGFAWGHHPGFMLQVRVSSWLKRGAGFNESGGTVLAFYPGGRVPLGPTALCRDSDLPAAPEVGDQVLLFPQRSQVQTDPPIMDLATSGAEIVVGSGGAVSASPHMLQIIGSGGFPDLIRSVEAVLLDQAERGER